MKAIGNSFLLVVGIVAAHGQSAVALTVPNTFSSGSPAKASEVNQNFDAVKAAIDSNAYGVAALTTTQSSLQARLETIESRQLLPSLKVRAKSNSALLGYVLGSPSAVSVTVVTSQGYVVKLGHPEDTFRLKFSDANCTGAAYAEFELSGSGPLNNGFISSSLGHVYAGWAISKDSSLLAANPAQSGMSYMGWDFGLGGMACINGSWVGVGAYYAAIANDPLITGVPFSINAADYKIAFD